MTSWVVVSKETGNAVFETFDRGVADKVNLNKYRVVPILEWLGGFNARVRAAADKKSGE